MVKLESIQPGGRLAGVSGDASVEILSVRAYGTDAVEVTWKGPDGLGERILYRDDEPRLQEVSPGRSFAFDGDGRLFRIASEALRIRLAHLFDPYVAVNASQIEPFPHQLTVVYGEMLERQPLRFLLADDPGAGKTVMAGLLIKELLIRGSLERCLIIAPGGLVEQWQDELSEKFSLSFDILSREQVEASQTGNPFVDRPRLIARLDMLSRNEELKAKFEAAPEWDLIVCDEAHRMSASFFGQEVKYTKRFQLGALAGRMARHFLLMTATPHNGKEADFQLFMGLLDADRFEGRFREGVHKVDPSDMMRRLTKGSSRNNRLALRSRQEGIIPLAMELCAPDVEVLHLGILDRHALGIVVVVHVAIDFEAGAGRGGADQTDDGCEGSQRLAAPVLADEREQAVFNAVPFAGSGRQMANRDLEPQFAGEFLQFNLPEPNPSSVGAATVGCDQQA